MYTCTCYYYY